MISISELKSCLTEDTKVVIATEKIRYIIEISWILNRAGIDFILPEDIFTEYVVSDEREYEKKNIRSEFKVTDNYRFYQLIDKYAAAGHIDNYFWQDLWAAKKIYNDRPKIHFDIGSRFDGLISHLLCFGQKVRMIDIRPLPYDVQGVEFCQADATNMEGIEDASIRSMSAMCSIEHFGLGRYGDPIDPEACFKCFEAIQRKICTEGRLYISIPVGSNHLEFNAHRVFKAETIIKAFNEMELKEFSVCFHDHVELNPDIHKYDTYDEMGGNLVGLYEFQKNSF